VLSARAEATVSLAVHYDPLLVPLPGVEPGTGPSEGSV
jgi:hypothetical protein